MAAPKAPNTAENARPSYPAGEPLLVIVGPTASGKTALAVDLAERLGGEVVNADSVQIYRSFDIGSGKPTADERRRAAHHLIDVRDPLEPMDAAQWADAASSVIAEVRARGKLPIVCGGTFLWVRALLYGLAEAPPGDAAVRERHRQLAETSGRAALHEALARVDASSAARLSPNDFVRVSRALEVYELTNVPMSVWQEQHGFRHARHRAVLVGIGYDRDALHVRINARVAQMFAAGWVEEVRGLLRDGYAEARAMKAVGYKQVADAVSAGAPVTTELESAVARATRIFARRQRTWLRDQPVEWLEPSAPGEVAQLERIERLLAP